MSEPPRILLEHRLKTLKLPTFLREYEKVARQWRKRDWITSGYGRRFHTFARVPLLVIDDFGLKPLRAPQDEDFHDLVAERYEQGATIVTSNLDFSEWGDAFPNRLLGAATLDRLRHGAYRLTLEGQSYRSPRPMPEPRKPTVATGGKTRK